MDIRDALLALFSVTWLVSARTLCNYHEHAGWLDRVRSCFASLCIRIALSYLYFIFVHMNLIGSSFP